MLEQIVGVDFSSYQFELLSLPKANYIDYVHLACTLSISIYLSHINQIYHKKNYILLQKYGD